MNRAARDSQRAELERQRKRGAAITRARVTMEWECWVTWTTFRDDHQILIHLALDDEGERYEWEVRSKQGRDCLEEGSTRTLVGAKTAAGRALNGLIGDARRPLEIQDDA